MLSLEDFDKIDMRIGTITAATINKRARKPAYKVSVDLGSELGIKTSSAQITEHYQPDDLIGKQVVAVTNFEPIRIGDVKSEIRLLGAEDGNGCILLQPEQPVENGKRIF